MTKEYFLRMVEAWAKRTEPLSVGPTFFKDAARIFNEIMESENASRSENVRLRSEVKDLLTDARESNEEILKLHAEVMSMQDEISKLKACNEFAAGILSGKIEVVTGTCLRYAE